MGAGSIGSLLGGFLAEAGNNVTFIGRYEHVNAIKHNGLHIKGLINKHVTEIKAETRTENIRERDLDLILVTVKAYDVVQASIQIKPLIKSQTNILFLQNGIGIEDEILKIVGGNFLRGVTFCGADLRCPGNVLCTGFGGTIIGRFPSNSLRQAERVSKILEEANIPCQISSNIQGVVWAKTLVNAGINPFGTITELKNGELMKSSDLKKLMEETIQEGMTVAERLHVRLENDPVQLLSKTAEATADNFNSMLQDIKRRKRTEIDYINGAISRIGRKMSVKTPLNDLLTFMIRNLEEKLRVKRTVYTYASV